MSQENVAVVRRFEELMTGGDHSEDAAFGQADLTRALELLDEDVVFRPFAAMPGHGGTWRGHGAFLEMCAAYSSAWAAASDVEFRYLDAGPDTVVTLISFGSRSRRTGRTVRVEMVEVVTLREGRIVELVPYYHDGHRIVGTAEAVGPD